MHVREVLWVHINISTNENKHIKVYLYIYICQKNSLLHYLSTHRVSIYHKITPLTGFICAIVNMRKNVNKCIYIK